MLPRFQPVSYGVVRGQRSPCRWLSIERICFCGKYYVVPQHWQQVMKAFWVWGPRGSPTGSAKRALGFAQDGNQTQIQTEHLGDSERKWRMSLIFAWDLGFLLSMVVWCSCPLRHPWFGQNDEYQVSFISHLCPGAKGLDMRLSWVSGLKKHWRWPYLDTPWMLSVVLEDSKEIINSLTFTSWMYIKACVRWGADPSKNRSRKRTKGKNNFLFYGVPSVSLSHRTQKVYDLDSNIRIVGMEMPTN